MHGFNEKNGVLYADNVPLPEIADLAGTPSYVYSANAIRAQYERLSEALRKAIPADRQPLLCYACKANSNIAILKILEKLGSGLEIVSEGELFRGLKAGFTGDRIISTSFGKNESEVKACLDADLGQFNIEAPEELESINACARQMGKTANVVFRLNPNVIGGGHSKIATGGKQHKFGNSAEDILTLYARAHEMEHINPQGVSIHIGSQVSDVVAFKPGFERLAELVHALRERGFIVTHLDIGGGFPIIYNDEKLLDLDDYARWVAEIIVPLDTRIQMEPGRYMVGNAGLLLTRAQYIKTTPSKNFLVLDAGMNDLIRPALYEAYHAIRAAKPRAGTDISYDVVGPICESGDIFAKEHLMPPVMAGDLVAICSAGAYGFSMASNYNSRPLPAEVLVDGDQVAIIRKRQTLDDLISGEKIPDWL